MTIYNNRYYSTTGAPWLRRRRQIRTTRGLASLIRPSGFSGVDGLFRLLSDGTSERGLAILEVREGGPQVIDPAPRAFATASSY
jgi:hypothetical protein